MSQDPPPASRSRRRNWLRWLVLGLLIVALFIVFQVLKAIDVRLEWAAFALEVAIISVLLRRQSRRDAARQRWALGRLSDQAASGETPMVELRISRAPGGTGRARNMLVTLDGELVARLRPGRSCTMPLRHGRHWMQASMDWQKSEILVVDVLDDDVQVEADLPWGAILSIFSNRGAELRRVKLVSSQ